MSWSDWIRDGVEVEPSLYAADFRRLGEQVDELLGAGCRIFHFDCGDGHFVPPVTIGPGKSPLPHSSKVTFTKAGKYKFFCWIHGPDMKGEIDVTS